MDITFVTSAETDKEAKSLLAHLGLPLKTINMAKESMKAREVKRAKLNAKYAAKRKALLKLVIMKLCKKLPKTHHLCACTTVAN